SALSGFWSIPIPVTEGEIITLAVRVQHANATVNAMRARLFRGDGQAPGTQVGSSGFSAAVSTVQDIPVVTAHTVVNGAAYVLQVDTNSGTGGSMVRTIFAVGVTVTCNAV